MGLYIGKVDRRWLSRVLLIMLADIIGIMGSYLLALWARFDFHFTDIPQEFVDGICTPSGGGCRSAWRCSGCATYTTASGGSSAWTR